MPADFLRNDSAASVLDAIEEYYQRGWTDGLPVVPPTRDSVQRMLAAVDRDPAEELGEVPPRLGVATVESVAINAVMAGCLPEYFPVVLAAVEGILEPDFNLNGVQATTNPVAPLTIVSGPIVTELGFNYSYNCFGQGNRPNATVGRAVRLVMTNLGGGHPGTGDKSTMGQPAKYSFCVAESPDSPWEPLHVERGLAPDESGVTVFACNYHAFTNSGGDTDDKEAARRFLDNSARAVLGIEGDFLISFGGQVGIVFNPYIAGVLAKNGWTKAAIKQYLYEKARFRVGDHLDRVDPAAGTFYGSRGEDEEKWPQWFKASTPDTMLPVVRKPENYVILCCGDAYRTWGALLVGWGFMGGYARSRPVRPKRREGRR